MKKETSRRMKAAAAWAESDAFARWQAYQRKRPTWSNPTHPNHDKWVVRKNKALRAKRAIYRKHNILI
jgi:hypothetical protein